MKRKNNESLEIVHTDSLKNKRGITLVALVVTIVVLLILAAISINLVLGENGLITQAKEAREKSKNATNEEKYLVNNAITDYIAEQVNGTSGNKTTDSDSETNTVIKIGNTTKFTVGEDGSCIYENFLTEEVNGITYTAEKAENTESIVKIQSISLKEGKLSILFDFGKTSYFISPDVEILVKASNGEQKNVNITGGELERAAVGNANGIETAITEYSDNFEQQVKKRWTDSNIWK